MIQLIFYSSDNKSYSTLFAFILMRFLRFVENPIFHIIKIKVEMKTVEPVYFSYVKTSLVGGLVAAFSIAA